MAVAGIDVGNSNSCVALARKRGIDVLMNRESKRETPSVVAFSDRERAIGTDGAARMTTNLKNTVTEIKRLLGKPFSDPQVQHEIARKAYKIVQGPDGSTLIEVEYQNQKTQFYPEQLLAMQLLDLKKIAEHEQGSSIADWVLSVPVYFGEPERHALRTACQIAQIAAVDTEGKTKGVHFINETTAAALSYGFYKTDVPEADKDPINVAFVDVGHASTQVSVVSFVKGKMDVRSHAWDQQLGGRDFDEALFEHFAGQFKAKYGLDIHENAKSSLRLRVGCEKVKKILSGITEAVQMIESLMDDRDFELRISREEFEGLATDVLNRLIVPMKTGLDLAKIDVKQVNSVELFGGGSRIPAVANAVKEFFEQEPSRTLHQKEVVSRGCALKCAMVNPYFSVKNVEIRDWYADNIIVSFDKEDGSVSEHQLFMRGNSVPSTKDLKIIRKTTDNFTVKAERLLEDGARQLIGSYEIGPVVIPEGQDKVEVKVRTKLEDVFGLFKLESVYITYVEEYEEAVEVKPVKEPTKDAEPENVSNTQNGKSGDAEMADANGQQQQEQQPPDNTQQDEKQEQTNKSPAAENKIKVEKKKRTKRIDIAMKTKFSMGMSQELFNRLLEQEGQMMASDREHIETSEAKNAFEAYVYNLRNGLFDKLSEFVKEDERSKLVSELDQWENWLYEDGEDERKSVYVEKMQQLQKKGDPIMFRFNESQSRVQAKTELQSRCQMLMQLAASDAPELAHITPEERATVIQECQQLLPFSVVGTHFATNE
eukprot:TRINITY_DN1949_c0_g1_i7.p1 TRINITY_DN1949_c0_g1~~TRINITY_DN1949_c0_g1_i7.p1  ORF type:complete len:767 (-),score=149.43 TRINITY_DN1949_c0_g1_i7:4-2304(-)